jgi:hypothetical protein
VDVSLPELCRKYPYLGRDQIRRALKTLMTARGKNPQLVIRKGREMGVGFLYKPVPRDGFCEEPHKFSVDLATELGVVPAIIYRSMAYWIRRNWLKQADAAYAKLDPPKFEYNEYAMRECALDNTRKAAASFMTVEALMEHRPYIRRRNAFYALCCLRDEGFLTRNYLPHRIPSWSLPVRTLASFKRNMLESCKIENISAKTKSVVQKPNDQCKNQTTSAKTKRSNQDEQPEEEALAQNSEVVHRTVKEEVVPAAQEKRSIQEDNAEFGKAEHRRQVLANAHQELKSLNHPAKPSRKKKRKTNPEGWFKKRPYQKHDEWSDLNDE